MGLSPLPVPLAQFNKPMKVLDELTLSMEQSSNNTRVQIDLVSLTSKNQLKMKPRTQLSHFVNGALVDIISSPLSNLCVDRQCLQCPLVMPALFWEVSGTPSKNMD